MGDNRPLYEFDPAAREAAAILLACIARQPR